MAEIDATVAMRMAKPALGTKVTYFETNDLKDARPALVSWVSEPYTGCVSLSVLMPDEWYFRSFVEFSLQPQENRWRM